MKTPKAKQPTAKRAAEEPTPAPATPTPRMAIHLVEKRGLIRVLDLAADEYESGFWLLGAERAQALVGGDVYFHAARADPSFFGGRVLGFRVQGDGEFAGRIVLRLRSDLEHKGVTTGRDGWSMEKKIVAVVDSEA